MKIKCPFLIIICLFVPIISYSEYYRYIDAEGIAHFTHDLNQVPKAYRNSVKIYDELEGGQTCCSNQQDEQQITPEYLAEKRDRYKQWNEDNKAELISLLEQTNNLHKEKNRIIQEGVDLKSPEFKEKIKQYNKRLKTLLTQTREMQKKAKQYVMEDDTTNKDSIKP